MTDDGRPATQVGSTQTFRADIVALIAYLVLAIVLTFPLVLHFTTHVPGDGGDDPALAWNLWWVPYAIINLGQSPIYTQHMFYPIGINLAFYTLTYLNAFLSIPLQYATNLVIATNANVWFSFVVGGLGTYLLVKYLLAQSTVNSQQSTVAAFIAGALYAFSANKMLYVSLGQFNIASSHWIPYYVLFLLKLTADRRRTTAETLRFGFLLGLFLLFQALSEFIYASFLIIFTALYLVYRLIATRGKLITNYQLLITFLVAVLTFTIPMSPILAAMIQDMLTEGDFIQQGLGFADVFSSDVLGFFVPSKLNPILGGIEPQMNFAYTNFAYLGFVALALAILALWKIPHVRIWGVFGAIFILISLGPALVVNGARFDLPMPFDILLEIPFVKGNRYPSRWSVMVTLALAVLVGYGIALASQKLKAKSQKWTLLFTVSCLLFTLFEHLAVLPLSDFRIPDVYKTIAQDKGDFTLLEIPLAWRNGFRMTGTLDQAMMFAQWYQTAHRRPILGGNTSRNPELKFQYFTEAPVISSLIWAENGRDVGYLWYDDSKISHGLVSFLGIRYIVWHSPREEQNRAALENARQYIENAFQTTKIYDSTDETGQTIAYRVKQIPWSRGADIRPDDEWARLHFAEGWGTLRGTSVWALRHDARIFFRFEQVKENYVFKVRAFAPMANQKLVVFVNGLATGQVALQPGWGEYAVAVPPGALRVGINEIILHFDTLAPVSTIHEGDFAVGTTTSPVSIVAYSAGSEVGDFAHIYVNGVEASPNLRGYNIIVINEKTGAVESRAAFDTFTLRTESVRMARFIAAIPNGRIVAVAVRDEASRHLTPEAVEALHSIGAREDLRDKFRWSHAIIGVKGASNAMELLGATMPAQLVVGIGATEPNVAAAIEWIKIEDAK
ncbi:MAG: hypothetical protein HY868_06165 [Chloroflexi bacterium]|nr:hypothetical protein [Chloroflexota bacterium]